MAKKERVSHADVLIGQAALDLDKELYPIWKKVTAAGEVGSRSFREFFPPFTRYAETLLTIEIERHASLPLQAVRAKVDGSWTEGKPDGKGLKIDIIMRIAPQPRFQAERNALQELMKMRLNNPHHFDESRKNSPTSAAFVKAAADAGIENDSNIFENLSSLPQRYLGDWFRHLSGSWSMIRLRFNGSNRIADICREFSLVMLDFQVWKEFFDEALEALSFHAENLLNARALREMELRAIPRRNSKNPEKKASSRRPTKKNRDLTRGVPAPSDADRGEARSAWLDERRGGKKWTSDLEIEGNGGPTYNTIQRYRSGRTSTHEPSVRLKFARAFGCVLKDVPD